MLNLVSISYTLLCLFELFFSPGVSFPAFVGLLEVELDTVWLQFWIPGRSSSGGRQVSLFSDSDDLVCSPVNDVKVALTFEKRTRRTLGSSAQPCLIGDLTVEIRWATAVLENCQGFQSLDQYNLAVQLPWKDIYDLSLCDSTIIY